MPTTTYKNGFLKLRKSHRPHDEDNILWPLRGFLIKGHCLDVANPKWQLWITTKHCIQCGNVIDPMNLKNEDKAPTSL